MYVCVLISAIHLMELLINLFCTPCTVSYQFRIPRTKLNIAPLSCIVQFIEEIGNDYFCFASFPVDDNLTALLLT